MLSACVYVGLGLAVRVRSHSNSGDMLGGFVLWYVSRNTVYAFGSRVPVGILSWCIICFHVRKFSAYWSISCSA